MDDQPLKELVGSFIEQLSSKYPSVDWKSKLNEIIDFPKVEKSNEIIRKIDECKKLISQGHSEIKRIQDEECPHINIKEQLKSNTGHWSVVDNCYWKEVWCEDCGKTATYDSTDPRYKKKGF